MAFNSKDTAAFKGVWVFCEQRDGVILSTGYQLLSEGRKLANDLGVELCGVLLGHEVNETYAKALGGYGADRVYICDHPLLKDYTTDAYTKVICDLVEDKKPEAFLKTTSTIDVDNTKFEANTNLKMTRPAFGGHLMATIVCPDYRPQMSTVRPGVMQTQAYNEETAAKTVLEKVDVQLTKEDIHVDLVEIVKSAKKAVDLIGADVVVSVGRGISADPKRGLEIAEELANVLGGVVGASRAVVDDGYIGVDHQVGQTGKTVHPKIYVALGISGAIQHVSGMQDAECIIAVNKNANAPIFDVATYGITGDLFKVGPMLTEAIAKFKAEKA